MCAFYIQFIVRNSVLKIRCHSNTLNLESKSQKKNVTKHRLRNFYCVVLTQEASIFSIGFCQVTKAVDISCFYGFFQDILLPTNKVCEGYVFTHFCLSTGGVPGQVPPGRYTPQAGTLPWAGTPWACQPPTGRYH